MGHLLEYSGIVTKTRAMESRLLSPGQFQELASLHTIPEAVEYLKKNTGQNAEVKKISMNTMQNPLNPLSRRSFTVEISKSC